MTRPSSWISDIKYKNGFLAIFLARENAKDTPVALLYGPHGENKQPIPSYIPGLLQMYKRRDEASGEVKNSVGVAYNRLIKHAKDEAGNPKYAYQRIEGSKEVAELRRMMES